VTNLLVAVSGVSPRDDSGEQDDVAPLTMALTIR
jgi:hypothetical protein